MTATKQELMDIELATVAQRMLPQGCNALGNLNRLPLARLAGLNPHMLEGLPVLLCGAGPSLDEDDDALRALAERSVVVAVSTAAPSLLKKGIRIDAVTVMESMDTSPPVARLEGQYGSAWLDLACHPNTWRACADRPILAYHGPSPEVWMVTWGLNAVPIMHGGSVTTAAAAVAMLMGCRDLTVVGCDFAFRPDGRVYTEGGGWGQEFVKLDDAPDENGHTWLEWTQRAEWKDDLVEEGSGVRPFARRSYKTVKGWDGEDLAATMDYVTQWLWFQRLRGWWPHARFVNCSVGGARISGFDHKTLAEQVGWTRQQQGDPGPTNGDLYLARLDSAPPVGESASAVKAYAESSARNAKAIGECVMAGASPAGQPWLHDTGPVETFTAERKIALMFAQRQGQTFPAAQVVAWRRQDSIAAHDLVLEAMEPEEESEEVSEQ